jgi:hypothetical protein
VVAIVVVVVALSFLFSNSCKSSFMETLIKTGVRESTSAQRCVGAAA